MADVRNAKVVVAGAGLGGFRITDALRRAGHQGEIELIGAEQYPPYDRPPLSKEVLRGERLPGDIRLCDDAFFAEHDVRLRLGRTASFVDTTGREVALDDGQVVRYDHLVIATGLAARTLPGADMPGIHTLRSLDDCLALRRDLRSAASVLIVGAGFIGCEVAASLRAAGMQVTVVEPQASPLAGVLSEQVGGLLARLHTDEGVDLRCGTGVRRFLGTQRCTGAELTDGTTIDAEVVVLGVGSEPATGWLDGSGLAVADGVLCDEQGRASAPGVWAVGDVAAWRDPGRDRHRRIEHWTRTGEQARTVARAILGTPDPGAAAPYVWSDQYGMKIQVVGDIGSWDEVSVLADDGRKFLAAYSTAGMLTAVVGAGQAKHVARLRARLGEPLRTIEEVTA